MRSWRVWAWLLPLALAASACAAQPRIEDQLMAARGKPQALAKLLRAPVAYGGLLFFDPECTRQFPQPMLVREDKLAAFASCLATLPFVESPRFTTLTGS